MSVRALRRGTMAGRGAVVPSTTNVLSLPGTAGNYASTPDSVANSITGDIDIRAKVAADNWVPGGEQDIVAKMSGAGQWSYNFGLAADGKLLFYWSSIGSNTVVITSTAGTGLSAAAVKWIRGTRVQSSGVVTFYLSDDGSAWTPLGDSVVSSPGTAMFNSTVPVEVGAGWAGDIPFAGKIYVAEIRDGVDGTVVQSFDATAVTKIGTRNPSTVAAGGPWTINGSAWDWVEVA